MSQHSANIAMLRALAGRLKCHEEALLDEIGQPATAPVIRATQAAFLTVKNIGDAIAEAADELEANEPKLRDEGQVQFKSKG